MRDGVGPGAAPGPTKSIQLPAGPRRVARESWAAAHGAGLGDELSPGLRSRRSLGATDALVVLS